ncbi:hypothetical protein HPP92_020666 [Vanilla planifolia]|uniref:SEC7 domain-containing protein n=1 Tax=Vanilla planifolia TaxID=51239 RepID=A0A835PV90_VANPL|nr:hypothetical protein HPP92_020666 [Vanilla planifolia]
MASLEEADSRLSPILVPALEKIVKNASWRKGHSKLSNQCKSLIDRLSVPASGSLSSASSHPPDSPTSSSSLPGPLADLSLAESEAILTPLISACSSSFLKIAEPALDCIQRLISHGLLHGEADPSSSPSARLLSQLIEATCSCHSLADDSAELLVLKTLLSAVTSTSLRIHGDSLLLIVRTIYDLYLSSKNPVNQTTAKASLIQILLIVFRRMEADSSTLPVQPIVVADLIDPTADCPSWEDGNVAQFVQGFITRIISDLDSVLNSGSMTLSSGNHRAFESTAVENTNPTDLLDSTDKDMLDAKYWEISMYKTALEGRKDELGGEGMYVERDDDVEVQIGNRLNRDAFLVFRALCKLTMKNPPKEALADTSQMKGKIVALELLKILLENAGAVFRTSDRFLGAIKQYLCLSLLKNCALPLMTVFQLSCSIFMSLVSRFRPGLKAEIGVFFPMIVLRVLENVAQPNFRQKMIVLRFLEKLSFDSQILVDIFVNYDCDIHSPNILRETISSSAESVGDLFMVNGNVEDSSVKLDSETVDIGVPEAASLEQRQAYKLNLQEGISLFNRKPEKGIQFLINAKMIGESPQEIASFLKNTVDLNKARIGDYLGERNELPVNVMHAYVDSFDFQGMEIDEAMRAFFQGFRLPGVALKIDCILEKFAERYCKCNPKTFSSADTAYVLSYSIVMLNTDAHNPMVKNKMSADDFIRNNHGIDNEKDLPEDYLRSLYERISNNEIKMRENELAPQLSPSVHHNKQLSLDSILNIVIHKWVDRTSYASEDPIKRMQEQLNERARPSECVYCVATDVAILRYMTEVCWAPMLAAFSVALDQSDDLEVISACLEGFRYAIHVTAAMSMKTQRDAFVTSLAKFTFLHSAADIKQRNIDAIKAIILIADEDGDFLQDAWEHVLTCISRFEHLHLLGEGSPPDATFFAIQPNEIDKPKHVKSTILPVLKRKGPGRLQQAAATARRGSYDSAGVGGHASGMVTSEQMSNLVSNLHLLEQVTMSEMNHIFAQSQNLNSEAIIDFVNALCKVSMEELRSTSEPRVFSLTKIVEIVHYNMNRIRLVWSSIWNVLSDFFVIIGCLENLSVSIFAMDSLRQLAMKFLDREELANYNFQNEFMKPFVIVMLGSTRISASKQFLYFSYVQIKLAKGDFGSFRRNRSMEVSADKGPASPYLEMDEKTNNTKFVDKDGHLLLWFPLLAGISLTLWVFLKQDSIRVHYPLFSDPYAETHGHLFSLPLWERVFDSVLFPLFDYVRHAIDPSVENMQTDGLEKWLEVVLSLKEAATATVPDFSLISSDTLLADVVKKSRLPTYGSSIEELGILINEDLEGQRARALHYALTDVKCRVAVQLLLIQAAIEIVNMFQGKLSAKNIVILFEGFHGIAIHAHKINSDLELRSRLLDLGPMTQMQDPPLLRLENESYHICLTLLQNVVNNPSDLGRNRSHWLLLVELCKEILQVYIGIAQLGHPASSAGKQLRPLWQIPTGSSKRRELAARAPVVVATLQAICELGTSSFERNLALFFPLLSSLICCEHGSSEVQEVCNGLCWSLNLEPGVRRLLLKQITVLPSTVPSDEELSCTGRSADETTSSLEVKWLQAM